MCVVCGQPLGVTWIVDHFDEAVCHRCTAATRCLGCAANTGGHGARAPTPLVDGRVRCRRCSRGAVDARADVAPVVRLVRPFMQSLGLQLPNRVRVELASVGEMAARGGGSGHHGFTMTAATGFGPPQVTELRIVHGLPATLFGQVLAHEMGHGWLAACPDVGRAHREEEGLCELVASWWLEHRGGRLAAHLLASMRANPDPVYGAGFRLAARAAAGLSPDEVVARVSRTGRI